MKPGRTTIPLDHPLRDFLRKLTTMSFKSIRFHDQEIMFYVADLLADFAHIDNLYKLRDVQGRRLEYLVDMLLEASARSSSEEREARKHIGDYCLFIVGLFPESFGRRGRKSVSPEYYIEQGKESYLMVSEFDQLNPTASFFRKLSSHFEICVNALNIEKDYLYDPFYQYLMRQML
ncbi:MAG: hypothetical protein HY731_14970 [Candidatus Tectomicrobia bacterium]|nr:hypothetical protein [Candidatus Tectomicrobia bacterium]